MTHEDVRLMVSAALASIADELVRDAIEALLIEPRSEVRRWEYTRTNADRECWIIAESKTVGYGLAYCETGFSDHWGFVELGTRDLGADFQWHVSLFDAFVNSPLWGGGVPEGYEVP